MVGGAGIDAISSAQSRRVGTSVEHGGTGLDGGSTRGRGDKTAAGGVSDTLVAAKDTSGSETDHLRGVWGTSRGGLEGVGGCSSRRWRWWGQQESSVEQTMQSNEHSRSSSRESVSSAVDSPCASVTASLTVSQVSVAIRVLDNALVVVFRVVAVIFVTVVGGDTAVALGGSRFGMGVWGTSRGAGWSGRSPGPSLGLVWLTESFRQANVAF